MNLQTKCVVHQYKTVSLIHMLVQYIVNIIIGIEINARLSN